MQDNIEVCVVGPPDISLNNPGVLCGYTATIQPNITKLSLTQKQLCPQPTNQPHKLNVSIISPVSEPILTKIVK